MYRLVLLSGGPKNATLLLVDASVGVGRDDDNAIQVDDDFLSRHHAVLVRNGSGYLLRDLGSRNGTLVNGRPAKEASLQSGDLLRFGGLELRYESVPDPAPPAAATDLAPQHDLLASEAAAARQQLAELQRRQAEQATAESCQTQARFDAAAREHQERVEELTTTARLLEAQLADATKQLAAERGRVAEQETTAKDKLAAVEAAARAERDRLTADLAVARAEIQTAQRDLATAASVAANLAELTQHHTIVSAELTAAQTAAAEVRQQLAMRQAELEQSQAVAADAAGRAEQATAESRQIQARLEAAAREHQERVDQLTVAAQSLEAQLAAAAKDLATERQRAAAQETAAKEKLATVEGAARAERDRLTADLAVARAEIQTAQRDLATAASVAANLAELTQHHTIVSAELTAAQTAAAEVRQQLAMRQAELEQSQAVAAEAAGRAEQATAESRQIQARLDTAARAHQDRVDQLTTAAKSFEARLVDAAEQLAAERRQAADQETAAKEKLVAVATEARAEREHLTADLEAMRAEVQGARQVATEVLELIERNNELQARVTALELQVAEFEKQFSPGEWEETRPLVAALAETRAKLEAAKDLPSQVTELARKNAALAEALKNTREEAVRARRCLAERTDEEVREIRRDLAARKAEKERRSPFNVWSRARSP